MGKVKVRFPKVGSVRRAPVFVAPEKRAEESAEDFATRLEVHERLRHLEVGVRLVPAKVARAWVYEYQALHAMVSQDAAGSSAAMTEEVVERLEAHHRAVLEAALESLDGVLLGDLDVATLRGADLVAAVEEAGLARDVALACQRAQRVGPELVGPSEP